MKWILFIFLLSHSVIAEEYHLNLDFLKSEKQFEKFHTALINVIVEIESKQVFPEGDVKEGEYVFLQKLFNSIIKEAHAAPANLCFFGGWASLRIKGSCKPPWKFDDHPSLRYFLPKYDNAHNCGKYNLFRCNPIIFGPGKSGKGHCVRFSSIQQVSKLCQDRSNLSHANIYKLINKNKDFRNQYVYMAKNIGDFCKKNTSYSACKFIIGNIITQINLACERNPKLRRIVGGHNFDQLYSDVKGAADIIGKNQKDIELRKEKWEQDDEKNNTDYPEPNLISRALSNIKNLVNCKRSGAHCKLPYSNRTMGRKTGYFYYGDTSSGRDHYGTPTVTRTLAAVGERLAKKGMSMGVGDISRKGGGYFPGHASHRTGKDVDLKLMGPDGQGKTGCTVSMSCYSRSKTIELLKEIVKISPYNMDFVFINDPELRKEMTTWVQKNYPGSKVKFRYWKNHHNHIHIRFFK